MAQFIDFFWQHREGMMILVLVLFAIVLLLRWVAWIFEWGRFKKDTGSPRREELGFVITDFFVKIVNDFRHLLALVVILVFTVALALMLWPGVKSGNIETMESGLKAVVASLGSIIAVIIGYYFGESAGKAAAARSATADADQTPQMLPDQAATGIRAAPAPPNPPGTTPTGGA